jgi:hypothetical protein
MADPNEPAAMDSEDEMEAQLMAQAIAASLQVRRVCGDHWLLQSAVVGSARLPRRAHKQGPSWRA